MPLVKFRIQYKSDHKYVEEWNLEFPRTYFDHQTPTQWKDTWEGWFQTHPNDSPRGAKCFFYTLNTDTGEMSLDAVHKILKLKPQPRILNDDSRQAPEQTQAPSNMAGQEVSALSAHAITAPFGAELENDF